MWQYPRLCDGCADYLMDLEAFDDQEQLLRYDQTREEDEMRRSCLVRTGFGRYRSNRDD